MPEDPTNEHGVGAAPCDGCGTPLAADQRYCLNCGKRRGDSRVDYAPLLGATPPAEGTAAAPVAPSPPVAAAAAPREPSPLVAVAGIALLGLMLLVGVLIGRGDGGGTSDQAATPTVVQVGDGQGAKVADTGAASGADDTSKVADTGKSGDSADTAKTGEQGSIDNPQVADRNDLQDLENSTGDDYQQASEELPDTIALPGKPPPTDNEDPGAGTQPTVIK